MCVCSFLGQVVYGSLMLIALGLTLVPMFTPGWQQLKNSDGKDIHLGIFFCRNPDSEGNVHADASDYCKQWWEHQTPKMKAVIACMCLAVIVEAAAIVWTIVTICACCCKSCLVHILPALAFVASILLAIAVGIYGVSHKDMIGPMKHDMKPGSITYSFYLACAALGACIADIIVGILTVTLAEVCL
ncbi:hypothetical protein QR680_012126 [Steinernema hermaphroditum]|uniref:Uncharacterized protein n=1 Tax=Steinernema hermaphroditum TaxID=289476 RepID=A0AA39I2B4_9BILA|nr:hypothetical protein QR680_012126 [Steinernema hermaphroditum]